MLINTRNVRDRIKQGLWVKCKAPVCNIIWHTPVSVSFWRNSAISLTYIVSATRDKGDLC